MRYLIPLIGRLGIIILKGVNLSLAFLTSFTARYVILLEERGTSQ
jgi:hypothetical protein